MEPATALSPVPTPTPSKTLVAKLVKAIGSLENIKKEGYNEHSRYSYVTIDSLAAVARRALSKEGLVLLADVVERHTIPIRTLAGKEAWCEDVMVRFTLTDGESSIQFSVPGCGHDGSDKALPKSLSNARKYCLLNLLNLGGEDPEVETLETVRTSHAPQPTTTPKPSLVPAPPSQPPLLSQVSRQAVEAPKLITERQLKAILAVGRTLGLDEVTVGQLVEERFGHRLSELTRREASEFLDLLKREQESSRP